MASVSSRPTCLLSPIRGPAPTKWKSVFTDCIKDAGLKAAEYSAAAVDSATCLLAYLQGHDEVLYQVAYAMGRGLKVLVVVDVDEDLSRYDPRPIRTIEIESGSPGSGDEAAPAITDALREFLASSDAGISRRRPQANDADEWAPALAGEPLAVATVEQAEQLFQQFIADGLSQELIRRLLSEAGCRQSWLNFRIQRQFGGW